MKIGDVVMVRDNPGQSWNGPYVLVRVHDGVTFKHIVLLPEDDVGINFIGFRFCRKATEEEKASAPALNEVIPEDIGDELPTMKLGDLVMVRDNNEGVEIGPFILTGFVDKAMYCYQAGGLHYKYCRLATQQEKARAERIPQRL